MDFKNAPKKRTTNFGEQETKLLIQLWGSPTVQNKLYLTHRKAPVMRLIAANMQKHGFYRTPDEIKTRIRNLKCLYHRIKKSMATGTGIGTIDPDWPHYKSMDEILSKKNALRQSLVYNHNLLSEVNAEIKEEIEDIEINDDGESYTSNSNGSDDEFEETPSALPATITPLIIEEDDKIITPVKIAPKPPALLPSPAAASPTAYPRIQISQNLVNTSPVSIGTRMPNIQNSNHVSQIQTIQTNSIPSSTSSKIQATLTNNSMTKGNGTLPFPLLILNGMPNGVQPGQNGGTGLLQKSVSVNNNTNGPGFNAEVSCILKEMLMVQRQNLEVEKERLEVEREKLEFERAIGSQLLNMVPMLNDIFQRLNKVPGEEVEEDTKNFSEHPKFHKTESIDKKRLAEDPLTALKSTKIFKETVINGIKKYMQDGVVSNSDTDGDSGVANDSR